MSRLWFVPRLVLHAADCFLIWLGVGVLLREEIADEMWRRDELVSVTAEARELWR